MTIEGLKLNKSIRVAIPKQMEKNLIEVSKVRGYANKHCLVLKMLDDMYDLKQYNEYKFNDIKDIPLKIIMLSSNSLSIFSHIRRKRILIPHRWRSVLRELAKQEKTTVNEIVLSCIYLSYDKKMSLEKLKGSN